MERYWATVHRVFAQWTKNRSREQARRPRDCKRTGVGAEQGEGMRQIPQSTSIIAKLLICCSVVYPNIALSNANLVTLEIDSRPIGSVDQRVLGTNILYWLETPHALRNGQIASALRASRLISLRFPGGEVADNYDWQTNTLDNPNSFPFSQPGDESKRLNFKEFLDLSESLPNRTPLFVVNLEGAYASGRPQRQKYINRAANWVQATNIQSSRPRVQYWEIGNESYHPGTRYSMSAEHYARDLIAYSRRMKAVDPHIKIGAIGPFSANGKGFVDHLTDEGERKFRTLSSSEIKAQIRQLGRREFIRSLNGNKPQPSKAGWWQTVSELAGDHFDFIILHRYDGTRSKNDFSQELEYRSTIEEIKKVVARSKLGPFEVAMTEWNISGIHSLSPQEHLVAITEQLIEMIKGGVQIGNYWPFRLPKSDRTLLDRQTNRETAALELVTAFGSHLQPNQVSFTLTGNQSHLVDVLAMRRWKGLAQSAKQSVVIVNRHRQPITLRLTANQAISNIQSAIQFTGSEPVGGGNSSVISLKPKFNEQQKYFTITLRPLSVSFIEGN